MTTHPSGRWKKSVYNISALINWQNPVAYVFQIMYVSIIHSINDLLVLIARNNKEIIRTRYIFYSSPNSEYFQKQKCTRFRNVQFYVFCREVGRILFFNNCKLFSGNGFFITHTHRRKRIDFSVEAGTKNKRAKGSRFYGPRCMANRSRNPAAWSKCAVNDRRTYVCSNREIKKLSKHRWLSGYRLLKKTIHGKAFSVRHFTNMIIYITRTL